MFGKRKSTNRKQRKLSISRDKLRNLQELNTDQLEQVGGGKHPFVPGGKGYGPTTICG